MFCSGRQGPDVQIHLLHLQRYLGHVPLEQLSPKATDTRFAVRTYVDIYICLSQSCFLALVFNLDTRKCDHPTSVDIAQLSCSCWQVSIPSGHLRLRRQVWWVSIPTRHSWCRSVPCHYATSAFFEGSFWRNAWIGADHGSGSLLSWQGSLWSATSTAVSTCRWVLDL